MEKIEALYNDFLNSSEDEITEFVNGEDKEYMKIVLKFRVNNKEQNEEQMDACLGTLLRVYALFLFLSKNRDSSLKFPKGENKFWRSDPKEVAEHINWLLKSDEKNGAIGMLIYGMAQKDCGFRDLFFSDQKTIIDDVKKKFDNTDDSGNTEELEDTLHQYLEGGNITYPEFVYVLKYYLTCCNEKYAEEYAEDLMQAILEYPNSDVLEIKSIEKQCTILPDNNIRYWLSPAIVSNDTATKVVVDFLRSFVPVGKDGRLLSSTTIKQCLWNIILPAKAVPDVISVANGDMHLSKNDMLCFLDSFRRKTAVNILLPRKEEILKIAGNTTSTSSAYSALNWVSSDPVDESKTQQTQIFYLGRYYQGRLIMTSADNVEHGFATLTPVIKVISEHQ